MALFHPPTTSSLPWDKEALKKKALEIITNHFPAYYLIENDNKTYPYDFLIIRPASYEVRKIQGAMGYEHFEQKIVQEIITVHFHHPEYPITKDEQKAIENVPATLHLIIADTSTLINRLTPK